jgi:hypothetical protein
MICQPRLSISVMTWALLYPPIFRTTMPTIPMVVCTLGFAYLCLVRALRWRWYNAIHKKFGSQYTTKTLTPEEAQQVMHLSSFWDMPLLMNYALAFALFKTYAIVRCLYCLPHWNLTQTRSRLSPSYSQRRRSWRRRSDFPNDTLMYALSFTNPIRLMVNFRLKL